MTALREAAIKALEAMDYLHRTGDTQVFDLCHRETTEALRAALAEPVQEPVQEPVAWVHTNGTSDTKWHPPQRPAEPVTDKCICNHSPLTDDQLDDIAVAARRGNLYDLRIAIERALKIGGTE